MNTQKLKAEPAEDATLESFRNRIRYRIALDRLNVFLITSISESRHTSTEFIFLNFIQFELQAEPFIEFMFYSKAENTWTFSLEIIYP